MKIVLTGASAEIVEKKSRFIATVSPVRSEDEASEFIARMKKQYWDCRHNCSAFVIGSSPQITRSSDDGEPAGTAGRPILDTILAREICDVCVVVSRYFGGTLLGTGGLVRAYSQATSAGLDASVIAEKEFGRVISAAVPYDLLGKIKYAAENMGLHLLKEEYAEGVNIAYIIPEIKVSHAVAQLTDITSGKINFEISDVVPFIVNGREIILI